MKKKPRTSSLFSLTALPQFLFLSGLMLLCSLPGSLKATHNLAGQITAEQNDPNNPNSYQLTLTTYTDPAPAGVDRCAANIEIWAVTGNVGRPGDPGSPIYTFITELTDIPRANGPVQANPPSDCNINNPLEGVVVKGTIKRNLYYATYVFPGPGTYELRYYDVARHESVVNISNSNELAFYVETRLFITPPIIGNNNGLILLNEPLDDACSGKLWTHNPGGFDQDGDSLVYYLRPSFQYEPPNVSPPIPVNNFLWPDDPFFGPNHSFSMDSITGLVTWDVPDQLGIYNFAYVVEEWRDGVLLGYVIRDMAVQVIDCDNDPPVIETIMDTCIYAGEQLKFDFKAWDPNDDDSLYLELNNGPFGDNGPFSVSNPATIDGLIVDPFNNTQTPFTDLPQSTINNGAPPPDTIKGTVTWNTTCENIRSQFYQVDFYATDNKSYSAPNSAGNTTLSANKIVTIRVIPPPPINLTVTKGSRVVQLDWEETGCADFVLGYNIYRKVEGSDWMQDTVCCEQSPADAGFTLVDYQTGFSNTSFLDSLTDLDGIFGKEICYVVTAIYDDPGNQDIETLESCATNIACVEIINDELFLTNDSVSVNSATLGEIFLSWSYPEIDSFFPEPYSFRLYRANNNGFPAIRIATIPFPDTTYTDTDLNTEIRPYNYRVEVYDALGLLVNTSDGKQIGSSIYLTASGANNAVDLSWTEYVPWFNSSYEIHRSDNGGPFLPVATVTGTGQNVHTYLDEGLNPNVEYCYFIRSIGTHMEDGVKDPLINDSQKDCAYARDEEPPCPPFISATGECEALSHTLTISKSELACGNDTDSVIVVFGFSQQGPFDKRFSLGYNQFGQDTTIILDLTGREEDLAGCYAAYSIDTLGNVGPLSEPACIDFCPVLIMSNVFTPNNDGINDVFKPKLFRDVRLREIKIFDRWGRPMWTTNGDFSNLWQGQVDFSNQMANEGVYYYYLRYEELGIGGNVLKEMTGWVTLLR